MNSKPSLTGIQAKTSLIFIGVFVIIILPVNTVVYSRVKQILIEADTKELITEGDKLFSQVRLDPPVIPLPPPGYSIYLQAGNDLQADSLFASPDFPTDILLLPDQPPLQVDTLKIVTLSKSFGYGNRKAIFSIGRSNQRLAAQLADLKLYLFAANFFSILVAGLGVYFVSGYTLRPILNIIGVAQRINASKSIERVPVPASQDENRQLALTINEMLARIENSIKNQTNFFASAAHELKTPLAVMQTELAVALNKVNEESVTKLLQSQLSEVQRLDRVIQDFLLISQLKSETLVLRKKEDRLDEVIYSAIKRCRYLTREKAVQLKVTIRDEAQPFTAEFDFDKLETVITNLIENATRYSPRQSVISIELIRQPELALVISNPVSEPVDDMASLKNEFKKSKEMSAGLGMGLWICDQIMLLHGGQLLLTQNDGYFEAKVIV